MTSSHLDDFLATVVSDVRDTEFGHLEAILRGSPAAYDIRALASSVGNASDDEVEAIRRVARHMIDAAVAALLLALEQHEYVIFHADESGQLSPITEQSDGLAGDYFDAIGRLSDFDKGVWP